MIDTNDRSAAALPGITQRSSGLTLAASAEVACLAPASMFDQPYVAAVMLDVRDALPREEEVQRLTEPFEASRGQVPSVRDAYEQLCRERPAFHKLVATMISHAPGVATLDGSRVKTPRSVAAKVLTKLSKGDTGPVIDLLGARVATRGIDPDHYVEQIRSSGNLPETLPGDVPTVQKTGSIHSVMYNHGSVGHKLAIPAPTKAGVVHGELLAYDQRDVRAYGLTRGGFEAQRRRALELAIGTPAVKKLDVHYQNSVDRW